METSPATTACPQCGATWSGAAASCPACGISCAQEGPAAVQPRWELAGNRAAGGGPWRRAAGRIALAGETAVAIALRPGQAFDRFRFRGPLGPPAAFAFILGAPALLLWAGFEGVLVEARRHQGAVPLLGLLLAAPPLYAYLRGQLLHLVLVLTGNARATFVATYRVAAYSSGAVAPLLAVPVVGAFSFVLAGTLVEAAGLRRAHGLTPLRAALIEAAPAAALIIGLVAAQTARWVGWSPGGA